MNLDSLDIETIEFGFGVAFGSNQNVPVFCPYCEDTSSQSPSCSVNRNGYFKCHGKCQSTGTVIEFYGKLVDLLPHEAEDALLARDPRYVVQHAKHVPLKPPIDKLEQAVVLDMITSSHDRLMSSYTEGKRDIYSQFMLYLMEERGLNLHTITTFEIGADESALTIPVYWGDDTPGIRRYRPNAPKGKKIRHNLRTSTALHIYPFRRYDDLCSTIPEEGEFVILCEGEWDALLLDQIGYKALTTTAGVGNWRDEWYDLIIEALNGRALVIMFDVNDKKNIGQIWARKRATEFARRGQTVFIVELTLPTDCIGGDPTDWFVKFKKSKAELDNLIESAMLRAPIGATQFTALELEVPIVEDDNHDKPLGLIEALASRGRNQVVTVQAYVVGKTDSPYRVPSRVKVDWAAMKEDDYGTKIVVLEKNDSRFMALIGVEQVKQLKLFRGWAGVPEGKYSVQYEIQEEMIIEELCVCPVPSDMKGVEDRQVPPAYFVGLGVAPNAVYRFTGIVTSRPKDSNSAFMFWRGHVDGTDIDTFELTDEDVDVLMKTFSPVYDGVVDVARKMADIADDHIKYRTRLHGRNDLHQFIDLAYHSPLRFSYGQERNLRGRLDVGVFGDTRTGKTQCAKGLQDFYGLGAFMSCENNATASGIMGGNAVVNKAHVVKPGRLPMAHRRLLICDELNQLSIEKIGDLTGTRSSGEVRIEKIAHGVFPAEARLIWLSNPRGRTLNEYCHGIEMVSELIGNEADVARFDAVLIIANKDIKPQWVQDQDQLPIEGTSKLTRDLCHKLILWVWSRKTNQVRFTEAATKAVFKAATVLWTKYHNSIPLILDVEARHKIARFSAAVAGRLFSTDDGETVVVKECHVKYAAEFLDQIYSRPACGFDEYSTRRRADEILIEPDNFAKMIKTGMFPTFARYVLTTGKVTQNGLMHVSGVDFYEIHVFLTALIKCGAVVELPRSEYKQTLALRIYVEEQMNKLASQDDHTTQEES